MSVELSSKGRERVKELLTHYPNKQAALIPTLWIAQEEWGWVSAEAMESIAKLLELPVSHVQGVASFYTMCNKRPVGRYHIQVCWNISCSLRGATSIVDCISKRLGIGMGETTPDKKFTLSGVECLASCGTAPAMQINDTYYENLTEEKIHQILDKLNHS